MDDKIKQMNKQKHTEFNKIVPEIADSDSEDE